jgi:integrase
MSSPNSRRIREDTSSRKSRIYWRNQGRETRAYADLRDLGGGLVALIPPNEKRATTDPEIAEELLLQRMTALKEQRRNRVLFGLDPEADLAKYVEHHLQAKAESGKYSATWLQSTRVYLARAVAYFTRYQRDTEENQSPEQQPRNLAAIGVADVSEYARWLKTQPNGRGGVLGPGSRRHHLNVLSGLFRRAVSEGRLKAGQNPVASFLDKPSAPRSRTTWFEADELALLLESARRLVSQPRGAGRRGPLSCAYELLATFILTGAREDEIRRLQIGHVDFDADVIEIPGTKTELSDRLVPLHRQLREILEPYVARLDRSSRYLFITNLGEPIGDWRKTLDAIAMRAGWSRGQVRTRAFRTSYITHRLACLEAGAPIDPYQVAREVGHSDLRLIMKVYGRVQRRRIRMEELAFRVDAIGPVLKPRLDAFDLPPQRTKDRNDCERASLVQRFVATTAGLSTRQLQAETGISQPTIVRLRSGKQGTVKGKTELLIRQFLDRAVGTLKPE